MPYCHRSLGLLLTVLAVTGSSCKPGPSGNVLPEEEQTREPGEESSEAQEVLARRSARIEFYADSRREMTGTADFFFSVWDQTFTTKIGDLPKEGSAPQDRIPYSGHWYPEVNGGTGVRQRGASALEKYDRVFHGGASKAAQWEQANHTLSRGHPDAEWAGHCNGWSAAASRHKEPYKNVTRGDVVFEPHDIKALLAEIYMSAKFLFLGGARCEEKTAPTGPGGRQDPTVMGACEDVNPGSFHASLANWIGKKQYSLVIDESVSYQVWNYPLYAYKSTVQPISQAEALRRIGSTQGNYIFNRDATKFVYVTTQIFFAKALGSEPLGNVSPSHDRGSQTLTYILELNAADEIIGGEWADGSQRIHPDFIWLPLEPVVGPGTRDFGNPHLNPDEVIKLWAESAGYDPNNLPPLLKEPLWIQDWGRYPDFEVTLDGGKTGAVFLGKSVNINIKRRERLTGDVSLAMILNGANLEAINSSGNADINFAFNADPGLNRLELVWTKAGTEVDRKSIRFHAMR